MLRRDIEKLIRAHQPQVIGILKAHGLVTSKKMKFSDVSLTQKGKALINMSDLLITDEWIAKFRAIWPPNFRGTKNAIRITLNRFIQEHDSNLEDIISATERWVNDHEPPYCGKAHYFFYKMVDGLETSRCEEYLDKEQDSAFLKSASDNVTILTGEDD